MRVATSLSRRFIRSIRCKRQSEPSISSVSFFRPLLVVSVSSVIGLHSYSSSSKALLQENQDEKTAERDGKEQDEASSFFDISETLKRSKDEMDAFMGRIMTSEPSDSSKSTEESVEPAPTSEKPKDNGFRMGSLATDFMKLVTGTKSDEAIQDLVIKARERSQEGDIEDTTSFTELLAILDQYRNSLGDIADKYVGNIDFSRITPASLFYYLESEDERKNPSWKRRVHRFCQGIDINQVNELNDALELAHICYADSVDEIRRGLENFKTPYELVYATLKAQPGQPANFIAIKRDQSSWSSSLEVVIGVRGTKTVADAITDLCCDATPYRDGQAHSLILKSGHYLVEKHRKQLEELCENSGKRKIKLTLIGHSLGAGAASIAGMEFNELDRFDVQVVGFGCPALVSQNLAEMSSNFITTVINDSDVIPRTSGITVANVLLGVQEFDWLPYADRDIDQMLHELNRKQPLLFNKDVIEKAKQIVEPVLASFVQDSMKKEKTEELEPVLFPPGRCIHLYRDGSGISGAIVANSFFCEIDVTRRMIDDHEFHSGYEQTFLDLMRQHKRDHHFRFDTEATDR